MSCTYTKKDVKPVLSPAPHLEALALPYQSERATSKPHAECIYDTTHSTQIRAERMRTNTSQGTSTVALC